VTDEQRPAPSERYVGGAPREPRRAAAMIVLRDASAGPEVLLVKRNPSARFMGGAWVFPGGAVHEGDDGAAATAARELEEEAAIAIEPLDAVPFAHWVTPAGLEIRFDTRFFVAAAPPGASAAPDGSETVEARWLRPSDALDASRRGELSLMFPTIKQLEELRAYDSAAAVLAAARDREIVTVEPRIVMRPDGPAVLMPGDPGFDDAAQG
jgi:8-oxo-dGTP pyrophosphatase MutT (NUDIX family)